MKRVVLSVFTFGALVAPAFAQLGGGVPNCERDYQDFWVRMSSGPAKELSGAQLAQMNRYALRGYDGCTSGDERFTTGSFFKKLEAINPAKADEFFRELEKSFPARR
jgi:hypothetical protein